MRKLNERDKLIWDKLFEEIKNTYGVAGLMGNLFAESNLNPFAVCASKGKMINGELYTGDVDALIISKDEFMNDGVAYGIVQWRYYTRKGNLYDFAKQNNMSVGSIELQVMFLLKEIKTYKSVWNTLLNATSVKEASDAVLLKYEKPANVSEAVKEKRASYGTEIREQLVTVFVAYYESMVADKKKQKYVATTSKNVFIRLGNGKNYTSVKRISKEGTEFKWVATSDNGWHAIEYPENKAVYWISGEYSKVIEHD